MTLDKSEGGFSPTTSYRDYAISRDHFHWETQNSAAEDTPTGRRYIEQEREQVNGKSGPVEVRRSIGA